MNLFGTDGIRGRIAAGDDAGQTALDSYLEHRQVTPGLMRLMGEVIATRLRADAPLEPEVIVGWDARSGNRGLTKALTHGLTLGGCSVTWAGEVATPGLLACVLDQGALLGCMITASHNPAHDSGLKLFDESGFKSFPCYERELMELAEALVSEDRDSDAVVSDGTDGPSRNIDGQRVHQQTLNQRLSNISHLLQTTLGDAAELGVISSNGLLVDGSKGSTSDWLATWLSARGMLSFEVSTHRPQINDGCGAGAFSPRDQWTWEQLEQAGESHALLAQISRRRSNGNGVAWTHGQVVGAALDGDGDRCLLLEVLPDASGIRIVDGDRMADDILRAADARMPDAGWMLAASVESDLGLTSSLGRFDSEVRAVQTAVGDRWLAAALSPAAPAVPPELLSGSEMPGVLGCEDSGHLVLPMLHPRDVNTWTLVGDGVMTLCSTLLARCVIVGGDDCEPPFEAGWKLRSSVQDVNRSLWDGSNELSERIADTASRWLTQNASSAVLDRKQVLGSTSLMLLEGSVDGVRTCLGVRNSGTEEKTSVSLRLEAGWESAFATDPSELVSCLCDVLAERMRR